MGPTIGLVTVSRHPPGLRRLLSWAKNYVDTMYVFADTAETQSIGNEFGAVTERLEVGGFIENIIQYAYDTAQTDWIIRLDDDELMGDRWERSYRQMMTLPFDIFMLPRYNLVGPGMHINDLDRYPDYQTRFFRKGFVKHSGRVHEGPQGKGISTATDCHIFHFSMLDHTYGERLKKWNIYNIDQRTAKLAVQYGKPPDYYRKFSLWEDYPSAYAECEERCVGFSMEAV